MTPLARRLLIVIGIIVLLAVMFQPDLGHTIHHIFWADKT